MDPFAPDFFQKFFSQGLLAAQTREVRTEPVAVKVLPLPEDGKPDDFSGAVGRFRVSASANKPELAVGEALDLTVQVEGDGNLKTAADPRIPPIEGFQVYDTVSSLSQSKQEDLVRSTKVLKTVLVPRASGRMIIPPVPFSFFDPRRGAYVREVTEPIEVTVRPGTGAARGPEPSPSAPGLVALASDIRYLKEAPPPEGVGAWLASLSRRRWPHGLPLLALALSGALNWLRSRQARDPFAFRSKTALGRAKAALRESQRAFRKGRPKEGLSLLAQALEGYVSDKLGPEAAGLPFRKTTELLARRHPSLPAESLEGVRGLWEEVQGLQYAPRQGEAGNGRSLAEAAADRLEALDREVRS